MDVEQEMARLAAENTPDAREIERWREFVTAYKAYDDSVHGEGLPVDVREYRPPFAAVPVRQNFRDHAAFLGWKMLDDDIANAEKYGPILVMASIHIDNAYASENDPVERWRMRVLVRKLNLRLYEETASRILVDSPDPENDEFSPE